MDNLLTYVLPVLVVGYLFYNIFKLIIYRRLDRERRDYEALIESKLKELEQDIKDRSRDLQDSMQMINQEYNKLMETMSAEHRRDAETLMRKMEELKQNNQQDSLNNQDQSSTTNGAPIKKTKKPKKSDESK